MFRPPSLLASQIVPTAVNLPTGRPRRLRPSRTCVVTFARIGYAIRLTTGNWRNEDFHLARFSVLSAAPYLCESFPGCLDPCHGGTWSACACFFLPVIGLPPFTIEVGFPAFARQNDFLTDPFFETAVISLCSGPQVCSPPRSFPPQWLIASGQPGLLSEQNMLRFLRMHRTLLTIRIQAIDGVGTYTPHDSQPCRLLQ